MEGNIIKKRKKSIIEIVIVVILGVIITYLMFTNQQNNFIFQILYIPLSFFVVFLLDLILAGLNKTTIFDRLFTRHIFKIHKDNEELFTKLLKTYSGESIDELKLLSYTGDMGERVLQEKLGKFKITVHSIKLLVKDPKTISDELKILDKKFPPFPIGEKKIKHRKDEIKKATNVIGDLKSVKNFEVKYYYGLPTIRVVLINNEKGFFSLYSPYPNQKDVTGSTDVYIELTKDNITSDKLYNQINKLFDTIWEFSNK